MTSKFLLRVATPEEQQQRTAALGVKSGSRTESDGGFHRAEQQKQPHDLLFSSCQILLVTLLLTAGDRELRDRVVQPAAALQLYADKSGRLLFRHSTSGILM